jgi:hypothetical protein
MGKLGNLRDDSMTCYLFTRIATIPTFKKDRNPCVRPCKAFACEKLLPQLLREPLSFDSQEAAALGCGV